MGQARMFTMDFKIKILSKGRIQKIKITKIVNMVLSVVGGVAAFHLKKYKFL